MVSCCIWDKKWPKGELRTDKNGTWGSKIFEQGTVGGPFSLCLYVADEDANKKIQEWLNIGELIGYHPFETDIPGTKLLDLIEGLSR